jgi:hypothetical protein
MTGAGAATVPRSVSGGSNAVIKEPLNGHADVVRELLDGAAADARRV